jgi:Na+-driven multidrug efflux pump
MWAAGLLFVYIPSKALIGIPSMRPALLSGSVVDAGALSMVVMFATMIVASLVVWFLADRLALILLTTGASTEEGHDYAQWQRWGLVFFGGWSALKACLAFENLMVGHFYSGFLFLMFFNVIVAVILIFGWDNLTGVFSRNASKV